jgi:RNA polymerase sigma-70 factor (ECF subfamily)
MRISNVRMNRGLNAAAREPRHAQVGEGSFVERGAPLAERSDEELLVAYAEGDDAAFRVLFQRIAPVLVRVMVRTVGREADANDLVQQTFLQLHRARKDFRADMRARPWIMTIAMNLARDLLRRRGRRPETDVEDVILADGHVDAAGRLAARETRAHVRSAVRELPRDQRTVIELHWLEELSFSEIAVIVGASAGAVRVRAHRGYEVLRQRLGPLGNSLGLAGVPRGDDGVS